MYHMILPRGYIVHLMIVFLGTIFMFTIKAVLSLLKDTMYLLQGFTEKSFETGQIPGQTMHRQSCFYNGSLTLGIIKFTFDPKINIPPADILSF